ncbi:MAG: PAS domain S-box protein [Bdellovibrionales bacterium]|nr:PAS domain S-box protein [Bdellovibrionales bacterium]
MEVGTVRGKIYSLMCRSNPGRVALLLLVFGLFFTVALYRTLVSREYDLALARFRADADERLMAVRRELESNLTSLWALEAFYDGSERVESDEFANFARPLLQRSSALQLLAWAVARPSKAGGREADRYILTYRRAMNTTSLWEIGTELTGTPPLRSAVKRAIESRQLVLTKVSHGPEQGSSAGGAEQYVAALLPIYRSADTGERSRYPDGFIVAVLSLGRLVDRALHYLAPAALEVSIIDDSGEKPGEMLVSRSHGTSTTASFRSVLQTLGASPSPPVRQTVLLQSGNHRWTVHCRAAAGSLRRHMSYLPASSFAIGVLFSTFVAAYVYSLLRRSTEVQEVVDQRTRQLRFTNETLELEIAERARVQATLEESEARFRELAANLRAAFWLWDVQSKEMLYMSPAYEDIWGLSCEELYRDPTSWLDVVHPEDRPRIQAVYDRQAERGEYSAEYRLLRRDGTLRWIWDRSFPIRDGEGNIYRIGGIAEDITARKTTEEALRQANTFLDSIVENIPNMIFLKEAEQLRFVRLNRAGEELLGMRREALIGKNDAEFFPEDQAAFFIEKDREVLSKQALVDIPEEPVETRRGTRILHTKKIPISNRNGEPAYLLGISEDITERKRVEAELRAAHDQLEQRVIERTAELLSANKELERLARIVESSDDAIIGQALDQRITSWNRGAERLFGYTAGEAIGQSIELLYGDRQQIPEEHRAVLDRVMRGEMTEHLETLLLRKGGSPINVSLNLSVIREPGGETGGFSIIARDITKRVTMELELAQHRAGLERLVDERTRALGESQEQLLRSERMASIGALAAGIAHEINNPVGAILLCAENALEMADPSLDRAGAIALLNRTCNKIIGNAKRCALIVKGVLQFAKAERSERWAHELTPIIQGAVRLVHELLDVDGCQIELCLAPNLPLVFVNPLEVEQVVINLIKNSLEAGSTRVQIRAAKQENAPRLRIEVEDNGRGITVEAQKHVFDPFYTRRQHLGGTGLGLSIVHGIIEQHGGEISIASAPGGGTCFLITLPIEDPTARHRS